MCMSSECESDGEHNTTKDTDHTRSYDTRAWTSTGKNLPITTVVNPNSRCFSNHWESFSTVVF